MPGGMEWVVIASMLVGIVVMSAYPIITLILLNRPECVGAWHKKRVLSVGNGAKKSLPKVCAWYSLHLMKLGTQIGSPARGETAVHSSGGKAPGFALVVTLVLMILLAVLCVSLLTLSSVALRTSAQTSAQATARDNARMALLIAIGDLQKSLGDDRKITATADIAGKADGSQLAVGESPGNGKNIDASAKGLSGVQPGTRYWTGVFSNADNPKQTFTKTPASRLERWLVSGNQPTGLTPASASCVVKADGTAANPSLAAVLVGPKTVGSGAGSLDRYVAAPIVPVSAKPGGQISGGYAYWIGDEGVKARINMERSNDDSSSYASLVAQRRGWETVEGFAGYPTPQGNADSDVRKIISLPTSGLFLPALRVGNPSPEQATFHSATEASRGLLVNTLDGGLRVDLTAAFKADLPATAPAGAFDNYPVKGGRVIPETPFSRLNNLTWDHLQEFCKLRERMSGGKLIVRERSGPGSIPITPIIVDFRILMGVRAKPATTDPNSSSFQFNPCGKFAVTIANPYPFPLVWEKDLEFEVKNQTPAGNLPARIWQFGSGNGACIFISRNGNDEPAVFNQAMFTVAKGQLEPGEARAYTISSNVVRPKALATARTVVPMAPFVQAVPFDFNRCVEVDTGFPRNIPVTIDVREGGTTTLIVLEMRLAGGGGSNNWLQQIEGCELDNAYFIPNQRSFDLVPTRNLKGPVPLMLYSYQVSQPGTDYIPLMPAGYQMGQRSSTVRTFADFNLRAGSVQKTIASYNPPPFFAESNNSRSQLPFEPGGDTGTGFTRNLVGSPLNWGHAGVSGSNKVVLYSVPGQFVSLAQLQHADLTNDEVTCSVGHQPGSAFGNSYATPFVKRDLVSQVRADYRINWYTNVQMIPRSYFDISHILNNSLWDRYFFSSIPTGGTIPENPTLTTSTAAGIVDLQNPSQAAAGLMVEGAFNINSTDRNAWKTFLASSRYFKHSTDTNTPTEATFPRSLEQPEKHALPATGKENDSYSGYRRLSDNELDALATEIVKQVRRRGPFVSISHFVNRALVGINTEPELSRSGALQLALDESGVNISIDGARKGLKSIDSGTERVTLAQKEGQPRADFDGGGRSNRPPSYSANLDGVQDWALTSQDLNFGAVASIIADRGMLKNGTGSPTALEREQGYRSTGIPGWVTQADVLQVIGSAISARSDTFRIRTMGQARDAAGNVIATAYCEAIVQRTAAFVDSANPAFTPQAKLNTTNQTYGRKFEIASFRWLSSDEI